MAVIQIDIPDAQLTRVVNSYSAHYGYSATLPNGTANPQTKGQFAKAQLAKHLKEIVKLQESNTAAAAAAASAKADAETLSIT